jgi:hypothetical protein
MNNWLMVTRGWTAATVCVMSVVAGCGRSDRATVSGTLVRKDGTPLVRARVIATSAESGKSAYGQTDESGEFELGISEAGDGVPPGEYTVVILENRGDAEVPPPATISKKYRDRSKSGINLSVEAGDSEQLQLRLDPP